MSLSKSSTSSRNRATSVSAQLSRSTSSKKKHLQSGVSIGNLRKLTNPSENDLSKLMKTIKSLLKDWRSAYKKLEPPLSSDLQSQIQTFLSELHSVTLPKTRHRRNKRVAQTPRETSKPRSPHDPTQTDVLNALADLKLYQSNSPSQVHRASPSGKKKVPTKEDSTSSSQANELSAMLGSLNVFDGDELMNSLGSISQPSSENPSNIATVEEFDLSGLDSLALSLGPSNPPSEPNNKLSYDDFFAGMTNNSAEMNSHPVVLSPRGDKLLRGYGLREDMNKRGMRKIKKKSVAVGLKTKGLYQMEDMSLICSPFEKNENLSVFAVFDGHVDKNAAVKAVSIFPQVLAKKLKEFRLGVECKALMRELFLDTDQELKDFEMEGTTATSIFIWKHEGERYLQCANVGDSTAFLCQKGKAVAISHDHKVTDPAERKRMTKAGAKLNKGQNRINGLAVSRVLGDHFIKDNFPGVTAKPHISKAYNLSDNDTFAILASDGLWDTMSGQEAIDLVQNMHDPQAMATKLLNKALASGKCTDNITIIVILL